MARFGAGGHTAEFGRVWGLSSRAALSGPLPRLVLGSVVVAFPFLSLIATQHEQSAFLDCGLTTRGGRGNLGACTCTPDGTGLPSGDGLVLISLSDPFSPGNGVWWGKCFVPVTRDFPEDGVVRLIRAEGGSQLSGYPRQYHCVWDHTQ